MCFHRGMSRRRPNRAFTAALLLGLALPVALAACTAVQHHISGLALPAHRLDRCLVERPLRPL